MLATQHKNQKWSVDPQNTNWTRNETNFGMQMLKKMGWEKGKGLGADENGTINPIKAGFKADQRGLGYSVSYDNNWVAHQEDFQSLLNQLNNNGVEKDSNSDNCSNLLNKSRNQKKSRYAKFTKGKNLSSYKDEDMAAIFGKSGSRNTSPIREVSSTEVKVESNTVISKYTADEYFKMQSKKVKVMKLKAMEKSALDIETNKDVDADGSDAISENVKTEKRKSRKRKKLKNDIVNAEESVPEKTKKSKKRKKKERT